MRVLNLLTSGEIGGIERLCLDIGHYSDYENGFCFFTHGGVILEQMKADGLVVHDLTALGGKFSFKKLKQFKKIAADYDVITVHHDDPYLKLYALLAKPLGKKTVTVIHSCFDGTAIQGFGKGKAALFKAIFQHSLTASDALVFVSRAGVDSYRRVFRFPESKVRIVYNGIRPAILQNGKDNQPKSAPPYRITYIGRLSQVKGVDLLLRAAKALSDRWPIRLHIVGDGAQRQELEELSRELGIDSLTCFHGQDLNIERYLQEASVFVYPSRCQEIFGISIVEAMSYGIPCVAANVGGIPEVIADARSGYLFARDDPQDLARKLEMVLHRLSDGTAAELVTAAKETAAGFSITNTISQMKDVYRQLLAEGDGA